MSTNTKPIAIVKSFVQLNLYDNFEINKLIEIRERAESHGLFLNDDVMKNYFTFLHNRDNENLNKIDFETNLWIFCNFDSKINLNF